MKRATIVRARRLRRNLTDAEKQLWRRLRDQQVDGYKFRRQQPIGPYIVDFVCFERKLIIEVDGGQHAEKFNRDQKRSEWLGAQGFRVIRFWNHEVLTDPGAVLTVIMEALTPHPSLSHKGERVRDCPHRVEGQGGTSPLSGEGKVDRRNPSLYPSPLVGEGRG